MEQVPRIAVRTGSSLQKPLNKDRKGAELLSYAYVKVPYAKLYARNRVKSKT